MHIYGPNEECLFRTTGPTPWIPGANGVGTVESVADGVIGIKSGDSVFIDPHIFTHTTTDAYDGIFLGLTGLSADSGPLQQRWRNGTFAEKVLVPGECLTPFEGPGLPEAATLSILSCAAIACGGPLRGGLPPGQVLIVMELQETSVLSLYWLGLLWVPNESLHWAGRKTYSAN